MVSAGLPITVQPLLVVQETAALSTELRGRFLQFCRIRPSWRSASALLFEQGLRPLSEVLDRRALRGKETAGPCSEQVGVVARDPAVVSLIGVAGGDGEGRDVRAGFVGKSLFERRGDGGPSAQSGRGGIGAAPLQDRGDDR